jgi:hypothetical protein
MQEGLTNGATGDTDMTKPSYVITRKTCILSEYPGSAATKLSDGSWAINTLAGETLATGGNAAKAWANAYYAVSRRA